MVKKAAHNTSRIKNGEYKELVDFLGGKFDEINDKFTEVNKKLDQKADRLEMETMFNQVNGRITRLSDKMDDNHAEQIGMQKQPDKHEKWHFKTAEKVGINLLAK